MSAAEATRPDKLSLVLFSGAYDKVHYALAMAAAALANNQQATLFFTMGACRALLADNGWHNLLPGENGLPASEADAALTAKGIGGFEELLSACVALGATIMVCEMGLRAEDIAPENLRSDVEIASGGLVTFLNDASATGSVVLV